MFILISYCASNVILFGPKRKLKEVQDFIVTCNNHIIKAYDHVKYLGVIIDNHLSGEYIVESIVHKVNNRLRFLYRQARFLDVKCKCPYALLLLLVTWIMPAVPGTLVLQLHYEKNYKCAKIRLLDLF